MFTDHIVLRLMSSNAETPSRDVGGPQDPPDIPPVGDNGDVQVTVDVPSLDPVKVDPKYLRTFSMKQVEDRIKSRSHIPEYGALLMECAVDRVKDGIVFNVQHDSWHKLVALVQKAEQDKAAAPAVKKTIARNSSSPRGSQRCV